MERELPPPPTEKLDIDPAYIKPEPFVKKTEILAKKGVYRWDRLRELLDHKKWEIPKVIYEKGIQNENDKKPRYQVGEVIALGGTAAVCEVVDMKEVRAGAMTTTPLVAKIMPKALERYGITANEMNISWNDEKTEALRSSELAQQNEHIVGVTDFIEQENEIVMIMPKIEGVSLDEYVRAHNKKGGEVDRNFIVENIMDIADGVDFMAEKGVFHRDLHTANIFTTGEGAKITDFGTATDANQKHRIGTVGYAAPEMYLEEGNKATIESEVYSLGKIAFELTFGEMWYEEDGADIELDRLPKENRDEIYNAVTNVIGKAIDPNPRKRYHSAKGFAEAFERAILQGEFEAEDENENILDIPKNTEDMMLTADTFEERVEWFQKIRTEKATREVFYTAGLNTLRDTLNFCENEVLVEKTTLKAVHSRQNIEENMQQARKEFGDVVPGIDENVLLEPELRNEAVLEQFLSGVEDNARTGQQYTSLQKLNNACRYGLAAIQEAKNQFKANQGEKAKFERHYEEMDRKIAKLKNFIRLSNGYIKYKAAEDVETESLPQENKIQRDKQGAMPLPA